MRYLLILLLLAGCSKQPDQESTKRARAQRVEHAQQNLPSPTSSTIPVGTNEMVVIDMPWVDSFGIPDNQRCYVWRDKEFKTASMHCPSESPLPATKPDFVSEPAR